MLRKTLRAVLFILFCGLLGNPQLTQAQKVYSLSSGELIFSHAEVERFNIDIPVNLRFTLFFHYGQYWHVDFGNHIGFYTGGAIRNVGFITDQENYKVKRRSYTLGVPFALKLGTFKDNLFLFAGGEYELLFHYKQKIFIDNRKIKMTEWFSNRTNRFLPSVFAGIQFPKGFNIKFKYYLDNFLNPDFEGYDNGVPIDYSSFDKTQVYYVSVSKQIRLSDFRKNKKEQEYMAGLNY
ncbi:MAG: hypothetical protein ACOC31_03305 [Bacteroidota bacterium]